MDWSRKHLVDIAGLCKDCQADSALGMAQQKAFAELYLVTKKFSSLPNAGGANNVAAVIAQICTACKNAFRRECAGRSDWRQHCPLMREHMRRQHRQPAESA